MSSRFRNGFKRFLRIVTCTLEPRKYSVSKSKKIRAVGRFSCSYNRQMLLYPNDCSLNNSEGSASQSDSGSLQQSTAAVNVDSVRSLRSLVSCLSLKKKTYSNNESSGKPNGVCVVGNGKYVFSELATIPGSPVGGAGSTEKKLKESGPIEATDCKLIKDDGALAEESFTTVPIPQGVNEEVRSEDRESLDPIKYRRTKEVSSNDCFPIRGPPLSTANSRDGLNEVFTDQNVSPDLFERKSYFDNKYCSTRDSVILVPKSVAIMHVDHFQNHVRRHSIERTIHLLEFRLSSDKRVHRSASAPSSLLQCALKAILPSSEIRIDNL